MDPANKTFIMDFFRPDEGGKLVRYKIELDMKRVVLREGRADDQEVWGPPVKTEANRIADFKQLLLDRGYKFDQKDGTIIPTYIPPIEAIVIEFQKGKPCSFPGYNEWKARYDALTLGIIDEDCTACESTRRHRKFGDELREYLKGVIVPHADGNNDKAASVD